MRVLLINPITCERGMFSSTPNLGLGYLATVLRGNNHSVDIWDGMKRGMTRSRLAEKIKKADYDIAGIQVYTCSIDESNEALSMIKANKPEAIRIVGGAHPSGDSLNVLNQMDADFAFRGEAEEAFPALINRLKRNTLNDFHDIPNLIWRSNGEIICNPLAPISDISNIGIPSWDLINPSDYPNAPIGAFVKNFPLATISCTRGCPHRCTVRASMRTASC